MQNHADTFKPPENQPMPDGKQVFRTAITLLHYAIGALSVFWSLVIRKPGSVGTRVHWVDVPIAMVGLSIVRFSPYYLDAWMFALTMNLLPMLYVYHLITTFCQRRHVHTMCVGEPFFRGGEKWECLAGLVTAAALYWSGIRSYGMFVAASALAVVIRDWVISERDRQKTVQLDDALWEQEYMIGNLKKYGRSDV